MRLKEDAKHEHNDMNRVRDQLYTVRIDSDFDEKSICFFPGNIRVAGAPGSESPGSRSRSPSRLPRPALHHLFTCVCRVSSRVLRSSVFPWQRRLLVEHRPQVGEERLFRPDDERVDVVHVAVLRVLERPLEHLAHG